MKHGFLFQRLPSSSWPILLIIVPAVYMIMRTRMIAIINKKFLLICTLNKNLNCMKQLFLLFLLITTNVSFSQGKDETAVRKLLNEQQAAWNRGNIDEFMEGYWKNDSLTFTGKSGVTYGWTKTLNNYKRN